jgi:hypothetical protein
MSCWTVRLPPGTSLWHDIYQHQPDNGTSCWVRRLPGDTAALLAAWTLAPEPYFLLDSGWQLPWYLSTRWRPTS